MLGAFIINQFECIYLNNKELMILQAEIQINSYKNEKFICI